MDTLFLSRLQFAAATIFHFLFVPLTLGLSIIVAVMETRYVRTGDKIYLDMTKFWGKIFLINFVVGVVTGITLEFQFGTNWSRYSSFVGDIFGSLLAIEATAAFFLESTLVGVWTFGWKRLSPKAHATVMWLVAGASNLSALWILIANSWMQHPVGYVIRNGRAELKSFSAVVFQKWALLEFMHTTSAALILSGFFVMGISAYHILKRNNVLPFIRSFRIGLIFALAFSLFELFEGHIHASDLAEKQPTKLAAMEAHWETRAKAPIYLFAIPDEKNERNIFAIPIPGMLSLLAKHDVNAVIKGLKDFPKDERPPVFINFIAFKVMVGLGVYFVLITLYGFLKGYKIFENRTYLKIMLFSIPLPYIACECGWILAEVGRQPWIVYGLMKTKDAYSQAISMSQVMVTLAAFIIIYSLLGAIGYYLIIRTVKEGIEEG